MSFLEWPKLLCCGWLGPLMNAEEAYVECSGRAIIDRAEMTRLPFSEKFWGGE